MNSVERSQVRNIFVPTSCSTRPSIPTCGDVAWNVIVISVSMFTLMPRSPLEYDYSVRMTVGLER